MPEMSDQQRKWWILIAMAAGGGLIMLDETVVGVALPTIRHDLAMSQGGAHWVVNSYMLVFGGLAAAGGKLGDMVGFRRVLVAGALLFGLASLACGLAADGALLIVARALQGIGAAVIFPSRFFRRTSAARRSASSPRSAPRSWRLARWSAARSPSSCRGAGSSGSTSRWSR